MLTFSAKKSESKINNNDPTHSLTRNVNPLQKSRSSTTESIINAQAGGNSPAKAVHFEDQTSGNGNRNIQESKAKQLWRIVKLSTSSHKIVERINVETKRNSSKADGFIQKINTLQIESIKNSKMKKGIKMFLNFFWKWKPTWDAIASILTLYYIMVLPFRIAFRQVNEYELYEICLDIFFLIDCVYSFRLNRDIISTEENLFKLKMKDIFTPYNIIKAVISLFGTLPYGYLDPELLYIKFIFRAFDFSRVISTFDQLLNYLILNCVSSMAIVSIMVSSIKSLTIFFCISHIFACIWIAIDDNRQKESWIFHMVKNHENIPPSLLYINSYLFTIVTFSTVGYGNVVAKSLEEYCVAMIFMFVGFVLYGYIRMNVIHIFDKIHQSRYLNEVDDIRSWLINLNKKNPGPKNIDENLWEEVKNDVSFKRSENFAELLIKNKHFIKLSTRMQFNLIEVIAGEYLSHFHSKELSAEFIMILILRLVPKVYNGNHCLISKGKHPSAIYFLRSGKILKKMHKDEPAVQVYCKEGLIGEDLFAYEKISDFYYIVDESSTLNCIVLSSKNFYMLQKLYPKDIEIIKRKWRKTHSMTKTPTIEKNEALTQLVPKYAQNQAMKIQEIKSNISNSSNNSDIRKNFQNKVKFFVAPATYFNNFKDTNKQTNSESNTVTNLLETSISPLIHKKARQNSHINYKKVLISPKRHYDFSSPNSSPSINQLLYKINNDDETENISFTADQQSNIEANKLEIKVGTQRKFEPKNKSQVYNLNALNIKDSNKHRIDQLFRENSFNYHSITYRKDEDESLISKLEDIACTLPNDYENNRDKIHYLPSLWKKVGLKEEHDDFDHPQFDTSLDKECMNNIQNFDEFIGEKTLIGISSVQNQGNFNLSTTTLVDISPFHKSTISHTASNTLEVDRNRYFDHKEDSESDFDSNDDLSIEGDKDAIDNDPEFSREYEKLYKGTFVSKKNLEESMDAEIDLIDQKYELIKDDILKINEYLQCRYKYLNRKFQYFLQKIEFYRIDLKKTFNAIRKKYRYHVTK